MPHIDDLIYASTQSNKINLQLDRVENQVHREDIYVGYLNVVGFLFSHLLTITGVSLDEIVSFTFD